MSTKYKIILGFFSMMVILIVVSALGYRNLSNTLDAITNYRRYALINTRISNAMTYMNEASTGAQAFLASYNDDAMKGAVEAIDKLDGAVAAARERTRTPGSMEVMDTIRKNAAAYKAGLIACRTAINTMMEQYRNRVLPNNKHMLELFMALSENALQRSNAPALASLIEVVEDYSEMFFALGRFIYRRDDADMKTVTENIARLEPDLAKVGGRLVSPEGREAHRNLMNAAKTLFAAVTEIGKQGEATAVNVAGIRAVRLDVGKDLAALSKLLDEGTVAHGAALTAGTLEGQRMLLIGSGIGVAVGLVMAILITFGLI
jgi:hypothetical protein